MVSGGVPCWKLVAQPHGMTCNHRSRQRGRPRACVHKRAPLYEYRHTAAAPPAVYTRWCMHTARSWDPPPTHTHTHLHTHTHTPSTVQAAAVAAVDRRWMHSARKHAPAAGRGWLQYLPPMCRSCCEGSYKIVSHARVSQLLPVASRAVSATVTSWSCPPLPSAGSITVKDTCSERAMDAQRKPQWAVAVGQRDGIGLRT